MLTMTSVIVDYKLKMFLTFYILQARLPNDAGPGVTCPLLSLSTGLSALITR